MLVNWHAGTGGGEGRPVHPVTAHWGFEDPAAIRGPDVERRAVFAHVYNEIESSVKLLVKLPIGSLGPAGLKREIDAIGQRLAPSP